MPFWVWTTEDPNRRRLFADVNNGSIELSNRHGWSASLGQGNFVESFQELNQLDSGVFIRPRALTTTMFSRLFASDLFQHGIGGAKYDQLNDEIIRQFFEVDPPRFMTMTATMKLPFEFESVSADRVTDLEVQLRKLRFHPELESEDGDFVKKKRWLVANPPESGSRKAWHDEITSINDNLFQQLDSKRRQLELEIKDVKAMLPTSKLLGSREFSFALFPEELLRELTTLAVS